MTPSILGVLNVCPAFLSVIPHSLYRACSVLSYPGAQHMTLLPPISRALPPRGPTTIHDSLREYVFAPLGIHHTSVLSLLGR
jgi:hypothetical protein